MVIRRFGFIFFTLLTLVIACNDDDEITTSFENNLILEQLTTDYQLLSEQSIAINSDSTVFAQYAQPTEKYTHGILGDKIEAEQLVVVIDGVF